MNIFSSTLLSSRRKRNYVRIVEFFLLKKRPLANYFLSSRMRPSGPSALQRPRETATTRPSRPSRDAAPIGIHTTRPSLPSREVAPREIAITHPSLPSLHVPPVGTATTRSLQPSRMNRHATSDVLEVFSGYTRFFGESG